jgi:hypothetical protein
MNGKFTMGKLKSSLLSKSFVLNRPSRCRLIRDSSAVRQLFVRLAGAVGHQSALHKQGFSQDFETISHFCGTFYKQEYNELNLIISYVALLVSNGD